MKKGISVLLALILCLGCFTGCVGSIDNSSYVPTGDALLMEGRTRRRKPSLRTLRI